ncbi:hypothetical protein P7K49_024605 [Saguinus oedipus]|uniref:Uncharacterized protein n=1 Tax=Saguinus oedipus TaxID=9490 RepID=A0ABQ9UPZ9_SAGOE|nr:hypothetical protein P7K49_024605 [Saguinus oedipus]
MTEVGEGLDTPLMADTSHGILDRGYKQQRMFKMASVILLQAKGITTVCSQQRRRSIPLWSLTILSVAVWNVDNEQSCSFRSELGLSPADDATGSSAQVRRKSLLSDRTF